MRFVGPDGSYTPPGNGKPTEVYNRLQELAAEGHITLTRYWCSEIGYCDVADGGHFHGQGAVHLPVAFAMVPDPGEGVECEMPPPYEFTLKLPKDEETDGRAAD